MAEAKKPVWQTFMSWTQSMLPIGHFFQQTGDSGSNPDFCCQWTQESPIIGMAFPLQSLCLGAEALQGTVAKC